VTTGGQILLSAVELRAAGAQVTHVLAVVERDPAGRAALLEAGLELHALFTMEELAAAARAAGCPGLQASVSHLAHSSGGFSS